MPAWAHPGYRTLVTAVVKYKTTRQIMMRSQANMFCYWKVVVLLLSCFVVVAIIVV